MGTKNANRRLHGIYRGIVVNNDDPEGRGRVKVSSPDVLGDGEVWALPSIPIGTEMATLQNLVPEIDTVVWLLFESGDASRPVWIGKAITRP